MAIHSKKLHIRKNGVVTDIFLYTNIADVGSPSLNLRDGTNIVYAKLVPVGTAGQSDLRVRKDSTAYSVLKEIKQQLGLHMQAL